MRFQCSHCSTIVAIDDSECGNPVGCGNCGGVTTVPGSRFAPGAVINDFIIRQVIGHGGMGQVYLAHQLSLDRPVALKVLMEEFSRNSSFIVDFVKEARAAARLNHPNIVQSYAVGEEDGIYFFAMEYVEGETLTQYMRREGVLAPEQAINIIQQISEALDFAWKHQQLVHRDVKPDNIMLTSRGIAKLADLGLARAASELMEELHQDEVMGTPQYICPEQLLGQPMDTRGDLYSLGATFYQMVTGRFPFDGKSAAEIARKHLQEPLIPAHEVNADLPEALSFVIGKMMAKKADDRYADGAALANDLGLLLRGEAPLGFTGKKISRTALKAVRPTAAAAAPAKPSQAEEEALDAEIAGIDDGEEEGDASPAAPASKPGSSGIRLKTGTSGKPKLKLGTGKSTGTALRMGSATGMPAAEPGGGTLVMQMPRKKGKGAKIAAIAGIGVVIVAVVVVFVVLHVKKTKELARYTVNSSAEAETLYFTLGDVAEGEQQAWEELKPFVGQVDAYRENLMQLNIAVRKGAEFRRTYPDSLFTKSPEVVDYVEQFNAPGAEVAGKIQLHAESLAGTVPRLVSEYEEALIRLMRQDKHKAELAEIEVRAAKSDQERRRDQAIAEISAYVTGRQRRLERTLSELKNRLKQQEAQVEAMKDTLRVQLFDLTLDRQFDDAMGLIDKYLQEVVSDVRFEAENVTRVGESDRAKSLFETLAIKYEIPPTQLVNDFREQMLRLQIEKLRKEIEELPRQEKLIDDLRGSWLRSLRQVVSLAKDYHLVVTERSDRLQGKKLTGEVAKALRIPKKVTEQYKIAQVTADRHLMVSVFKLETQRVNNEDRTVENVISTHRLAIDELPLAVLQHLTEEAYGPVDEQYQRMLSAYLLYGRFIGRAAQLLENDQTDDALFLKEEIAKIESLAPAIILEEDAEIVEELARAGEVANASTALQALEKKHAENPGLPAVLTRLTQAIEAASAKPPEPAPAPAPAPAP